MATNEAYGQYLAEELPVKRANLQAWKELLRSLSVGIHVAKKQLEYSKSLKENHESMCDKKDPATLKELAEYDPAIEEDKACIVRLEKEKAGVITEMSNLMVELQTMEADAAELGIKVLEE
ncbi:hypothetical protein MGU_09019 [Metarhizium guizhouense ARSEF 977]|uniref:Uncharacterized protein n=1 Tax=Metarhizium guizhouense (strain ARSEF 977) TaxID=1276136 RepID=A0A0B4GMD4_METGA|nr:hypothetical protein MGU_09019 [Metarhizium guizhouense ARSEF 977]